MFQHKQICLHLSFHLAASPEPEIQECPPQRGCLTVPRLNVREEEQQKEKMNGIFLPLKFWALVRLCAYMPQVSAVRGMKGPATAPSHLTSSYLALHATLSFIISSQGFTDVITFLPLIVSSRLSKTPCDKCVASTFEI